MNLLELTGIKSITAPSQNDEESHVAAVLQRLQQAIDAGVTKLRPLGRGANALALTDGEKVYKFWHRDSAYEKFVEFCMENPSRWLPKFKSKIKHLPRLLNLKSAKEDPDNLEADAEILRGLKYVKMELLQPFKGDSVLWLFKDRKVLEEIGMEFNDIENYTSIETVFEWGGMGNNPRAALIEMLHYHAEDSDIEGADLSKYIEKLNPDVLELMAISVKLAKVMGKYDRYDVADRNLALRDGQIVILDPIVDDNDLIANDFILGLKKIKLPKPT
jgi:hypothetical protein